MTLADLLSQLDPHPGVRGRQFESICRWYLRNAPEYRERIRQVWLWSEWPGACAADAGIDLVAEEHDGSLWAIQAKAYHPSYAIKKADVDSFLSESSRQQFSYRLLIATTDRLGPTARRTLDSQREPVGYLLRSQLELAQVAWPISLRDLRPRRPPRKKPLPHVREAIEATVRGLADQERGQLVMACGTGKTLAAMWIAEGLGSTRSLVLVPSLSLLAQTLREWSANASEPFEYLAACSDQTVVGEDQFVQRTSELGVPVTTDPGVIAAFVRRRGRRVVFATYQSSPQIAAAFRAKTTPQFDFAIADDKRRARLEGLPGWAWDTHEAAWEDGYSRLRVFAAREGHTRVPRGFRDEDGFKLGLWVQNNRARGHRGTLSTERVHRLESVAGWTWDTQEAAWEDAYARLRAFVSREGHCRVPRGYRDDDGFNLGQSVHNQRARGRRGELV